MRLMITTDAVGGVWTYTLDLADILAAAGIHTTALVLGPPPSSDQLAEARRVPGLDVRQLDAPLDWTAREPAELRRAALAVEHVGRSLDPHIVQLNSPTLAAWARFEAPVVGVCHSCVASWWRSVHGGAMPDAFVWRTELLQQGLGACAALVAPSAAFAAETACIYKLPPAAVVHNGRRSMLAGCAPRQRCVFTAGRLWDAGKGATVVDAAAARLDAVAYAAGPLVGPSGAQVMLRHATPLGPLSAGQMRQWLARVSIFTSMALYEPFGLCVLEAAQAGCALVLSDIPTHRELWDGAAVFVPVGDDSTLAAVLQRLLDAPGRAAELGSAAQARACTYTVDAMGAGMIRVYRRLLDQPAASRQEVAA